MKTLTNTLFIPVFAFMCNCTSVFAQNFATFPIKEQYDKISEDVADFSLIDPRPATNKLSNNLRDRIGDVLSSHLRMYKTTGDKAYLYIFIKGKKRQTENR